MVQPLPKPGCRHPDSGSKPDVTLSRHPAPQQCGVPDVQLDHGIHTIPTVSLDIISLVASV
jgi:hypothetical protein